ncbi:hypothetical protein [Ottowia thiooxydans]|uniref:hypothetical protein n=1 Tax=Ottowia thiooxydans TaxID=219182 RepID=UPI000406F413|nr:hypothetical protein [Ottowia thiooxydans]
MNKSNSSLDPLKTWREWFVKNEREWSESITKVMKDDAVAQSLGQEINAAIHRQQMFTQGLAGPMASMNIPSRADVAALGERIGQLEDSVARVEAALVRIEARSKDSPPRTRGVDAAAKANTPQATSVKAPSPKASRSQPPAKRASRA